MIPIVIPARLGSSRLPRKMLLEIDGLPMLEHVRRRCVEAVSNENVFVASGDQEIISVMRDFGAQVVQTFGEHENGTSRVREACKTLSLKNVIIVQGDEPLIDVENISLFNEAMVNDDVNNIFCGMTKLKYEADLTDLDVVKCICDFKDNILFMFRTPPLTTTAYRKVRKIQGLIGFKEEAIFSSVSEGGTLGRAESIEQLILLENAYKIKGVQVGDCLPSVNTQTEYNKILQIYSQIND